MLSRDQLIRIRDQTKPQPLARSVRKTLFKYNLWCPSSKRTLSLKSAGKTTTSPVSKGGLLNARSINGKEHSIYELIVDNSLDFLALTETWCSEKSSVSLGLITPPGYSIQLTNRVSRGGGVALIHRDSYRSSLVKSPTYSSFEHQTVSLKHNSDTIWITTVYVPKGIFSSAFSTEICDLLGHLQAQPGKHVIVGDFNFHVNDISDTAANKFKILLDQYNLVQHVAKPTHINGNTLEL